MSRSLRSAESLLRDLAWGGNSHVAEPVRTILNTAWESARTAARKPPTTAQADEALSRDLGAPCAVTPPCSCDPFKPKNSTHRGLDGWLVCANCKGRIGAENAIGLARNLTPTWSVMRRSNGTHYLYPGKHLEDPDCVQVHDSRVNADAALARLNTPKPDDAAIVRAAAAYMDQVNGCEEDTIRAAEAAGFVRDESLSASTLVQVEAFLCDGLRAVAKRIGGGK